MLRGEKKQIIKAKRLKPDTLHIKRARRSWLKGPRRKMRVRKKSLERGEGAICRKRNCVEYDAEEGLCLGTETKNSHQNRPELRKIDYQGNSRPTLNNVTKHLAPHSQETSNLLVFAVPSLSPRGHAKISIPELSQQTEMEQKLGIREPDAEAEERPVNTSSITSIELITSESEAAYRRQEEAQAPQEKEIACTGSRRKRVQDYHSHITKAEAVTLQYPFPELARVKSARMELEAAYDQDHEKCKRVVGDKAFEKLVVDVQAARRPHEDMTQQSQMYEDQTEEVDDTVTGADRTTTTSPGCSWYPSPIVTTAYCLSSAAASPARSQTFAPFAKRCSPSPRQPVQHTHTKLAPRQSPTPPQLAYAQYMAARQCALAQVSPQEAHAFASTPLNVRHAGPYTPISPVHYAHPVLARRSLPPSVPTTALYRNIPSTPMSPQGQQRGPSPRTPQQTNIHLHHQHPYPPPYTSAAPQTPHPPSTSQQQYQQYGISPPPPTRRHSVHDATPTPRESAEVMLRKLELEEAEAKLRASITQEQLRAEVVAKKKALARALTMEEKGLR